MIKKGISFLNRAITPPGSLRPFPLVNPLGAVLSPLPGRETREKRAKTKDQRISRCSWRPGRAKVSMIKRDPAKKFLVRESVISKENIKKLDKRLKLTIIVNQGDGRRAYG